MLGVLLSVVGWEGGRWQLFLFICFGFFNLPHNKTMSTPSQQINSTGRVEGRSLPQSGTALVSRVHICYKCGGSTSRIADHEYFTKRLVHVASIIILNELLFRSSFLKNKSKIKALLDICKDERHIKTPHFLDLKTCFSKYSSGLPA